MSLYVEEMFGMERSSSPTSPNKKLQRLVRNQISPSLKTSRPLKLRRNNFADPLLISTIIDQCGSQASHITHLDISYSITTSTTLKHFCSGLGRIKTLIAVECNLSHIEEDTAWPQCLQSIDFSRNKLTRLPQNLSSLLQLTELNLSGNLLAELDSSLLMLPKLQKLHLLNNPIQNVPKSICREGVKDLREFFKVTPLRTPSPEKMHELRDKIDLRRYALHNQGSVDSAYESHRKASSTSTCYSTSVRFSFSDAESIGSVEEEWPQFELDTLPDGYNEAVHSRLCQIYLPDGCDIQIAIKIVKDISLHPKVKWNELLITPVVRISPHGAKFSDSKPAIIVLNHCTKPSTTSSINILPLCSSTRLDQCPHWKQVSTETSPSIFQDCVMFTTTHFSLFAVVASVSYPTKSIVISPNDENLLVIQELPGFRIQIPQYSVSIPMIINATAYYSDPPYAIEALQASPASTCIGVEPHGIQFETPVVVSMPIPHFNEIKEKLPNANLQLYYSSNGETEGNSFKWEPFQDQHYELSTENDTTIATFETIHFSLFEFIWTVGQDALNKIGLGASNAYKYLTGRKQFISVRWQAFMTPPLSNLSFGLAVCVYKFGEPLKELSNYPWLVGDSGPKRVYLRIGELKVSLQGHFSASQDMNESLEHGTTIVDFKGDDFCARMDFALRLSDGVTLPLQDGQILGKLTFTQMNGDRPTVMSYNLIKVCMVSMSSIAKLNLGIPGTVLAELIDGTCLQDLVIVYKLVRT